MGTALWHGTYLSTGKTLALHLTVMCPAFGMRLFKHWPKQVLVSPPPIRIWAVIQDTRSSNLRVPFILVFLSFSRWTLGEYLQINDCRLLRNHQLLTIHDFHITRRFITFAVETALLNNRKGVVIIVIFLW